MLWAAVRIEEETAIPADHWHPASTERLRAIVETSLEDDQAEDTITIDLAGKTNIADYMIIASGRSKRHIATLGEHLIQRLKASGLRTVPAEGMSRGDWVLLDAGDVIVHLFRPEIRSIYNLEKMWAAVLPAVDRGTELSA